MSNDNLQESLKNSGTSASDGRRNETLRTVLVVSEVALACVLVVGAGLPLRSFLHVLDVDLGFNPSQASTLPLDVPDLKLVPRCAYASVFREISTIGGVETVGVSERLTRLAVPP